VGWQTRPVNQVRNPCKACEGRYRRWPGWDRLKTAIRQMQDTGSNAVPGVSNSVTTLFYYPVNHNNDSLEYTVSDGRGGVRSRKIDIYVTNYVQALTITKTNGSNSVSFYAVPGYEYVIQRSLDIEKGPWSDIATQARGTSGLYQYMEEPPFSPVFYRARTP